MQLTVYTRNGRAEKPNNGWWDNPKNSNSRKLLIVLNCRSTGSRCFFTKVEQALGSSVGKPSWDCLMGARATDEMAETLPYTEREGEKESGKHGSQESVSWNPEQSRRGWGLAQTGSPTWCVWEGAQNQVLLLVNMMSTVPGVTPGCHEIY